MDKEMGIILASLTEVICVIEVRLSPEKPRGLSKTKVCRLKVPRLSQGVNNNEFILKTHIVLAPASFYKAVNRSSHLGIDCLC